MNARTFSEKFGEVALNPTEFGGRTRVVLTLWTSVVTLYHHSVYIVWTTTDNVPKCDYNVSTLYSENRGNFAKKNAKLFLPKAKKVEENEKIAKFSK